MKGRQIVVKAVVKTRDGKAVDATVNPYRFGSAKREIFAWAMARKSFTKAEFTSAVADLLSSGTIQSVMSAERCGVAWWNEFFGKYEVFVPVDEE